MITFIIVLLCMLIYSSIGGFLFAYKTDNISNHRTDYKTILNEWAFYSMFWPITVVILMLNVFFNIGKNIFKYMKSLFLVTLLFGSLTAFSQDSTKHNIVSNFTLVSKNVWRGNVYGDNTPAVSANLGIVLNNGFELGAIGTSPINGKRDGYGIWMELYASQTIGKLKITVDDYYFFNAQDSLNDYANWSRSNTQHLIETRLKYCGDRFNVTASYVVYAASSSVNNLYLEAEFYVVRDLLSVSAGGVLGESYLNFYNKGGVTHIGFTGYRIIKVTDSLSVPMFVTLMTSPNYKNASKYPAFTQNPINVVVGLTF